MNRFLVALLLFSISAFAVDATLEVVKKVEYAPKIVVENCSSDVNKGVGDRVSRVLFFDLRVSTHFDAKESGCVAGEPNYVEYKQKGYDMVAKVKSSVQGDKLYSELKLYDVNANRLVYDNAQSPFEVADAKRYPFLSHELAIVINNSIKAPSVDWMRKYVIFAKQAGPGKTEIVLSDYTLSFQMSIAKGGLYVFPKWANKEQTAIYYTEYLRKPTLMYYDIYKGEKRKIIESDGMLACSDVSADDSKLLLTMAPAAQPDVYLYDVNTKKAQLITNYGGIDVSGHFLDDEKRVVFVSDRMGGPNIFAQTIGGSGVEKLTGHGKNNSTCSAFGNYVVYSSRETDNEFGRNTFNLYLISTKSDYIRRLTASGVNQFPKFSSDGESILFIKHDDHESALGIIRLNGNKEFITPLKVSKIQSIDW